MNRKPPSPDLVARFVEIVGEPNALTRPEDQAGYLCEWRDRYTGATPVVLRPHTTEDVSRILALAHVEGVCIVPQGGNTGLVGGQIPSPDGTESIRSGPPPLTPSTRSSTVRTTGSNTT